MFFVSKSLCFLVGLVLMTSNAPLAQANNDDCKYEHLSNCEGFDCFTYDGKSYWTLTCWDYEASYIPYKEEYKEVQVLSIKGDFIEMTIDPRYEEVEIVKLTYADATQVSMSVFKGFKKLEKITIDSATMFNDEDSLITLIDFKDAGVMKSVREIDLTGNVISKISGGSFKKSFPKLNKLILKKNKLSTFNFRNVPNRVTELDLSDNGIVTLNGKTALKKLKNLKVLRISSNLLHDFDMSYLPASIEEIDYHNNKFTNIDVLTQLSGLKSGKAVYVNALKNPTVCDCNMLGHFIDLVKTDQLRCYSDSRCFDCASGELASYSSSFVGAVGKRDLNASARKAESLESIQREKCSLQ